MRDSKFRAYPPNMENLVKEVQRGRWRGETPVGPMGMYIEVTESRYGNVIESLLSNTVNCFCVDNDADGAALRQMIANARVGRSVNVIKLTSRDIDGQFRGDQPEDRLDTVFRCVKVTDKRVLKALVINNKIHKVVLVQDRAEGDNITRGGYPPRTNSVMTVGNVSVGTRGGGLSAQAGKRFEGIPKMSGNFDDHLREMEDDLRDLEGRIDRVRSDERDLQARVKKRENEVKEILVCWGVLICRRI
jgi:chromosome segregation ATPase